MEESLSKFITAILAIVIMFIFPVYIAYEKKDDISYALAVRYTQDFVDKVRSKGYITQELYQDYMTSLLATGNTYDIELEHRYVRFDPSRDTVDGKGTATRSEEIYTTEHILNFINNNEEHKYVMNVDDNFNVKIKNTNVTMATVIYNIVTVNMSGNNVRIYVDYGGKILADKWWGNIDFFPGGEDIDYSEKLSQYNKYKIIYNDENRVEYTSKLDSVEPFSKYETQFTIPAEYQLQDVKVKMNGEDITNDVYKKENRKIIIEKVTGNVDITIKISKNSST